MQFHMAIGAQSTLLHHKVDRHLRMSYCVVQVHAAILSPRLKVSIPLVVK